MKVYAIVCEYGAASIYEGIEIICKTKEIAESYYNNYDFTGRPHYIDELEIVDTIWEPKGKKKKTKNEQISKINI